MRNLLAAACVAAACLTASLAIAQPSPPSPTATTEAKTPSPPARVADAAWLQGYWAGTGMGGEAEDVWLPAKAGVMLGAFRLMKADGKPSFYELFAIEEVDDTLVFVVKHFNPDWVGWEEKDKALRLRLTRRSADELAFGGVVFRRSGSDSLAVDVTLRQKDGTTKTHTFDYRRKPL
jgi:hypothetical protein